MYFASTALAGELIRVLSSGTESLTQSGAHMVARAEIYQLMNVYATKMAGVFMISASTIALRTRIIPRWMSFLGYALALLLLLSVATTGSAPMVFPVWVFLISRRILIENFRVQSDVEQHSMSAVR